MSTLMAFSSWNFFLSTWGVNTLWVHPSLTENSPDIANIYIYSKFLQIRSSILALPTTHSAIWL